MLVVGALVVALDGMGITESLTASLSCVSNIGPAFGSLGPTANFAELKIRSKYDGKQTDTLFIFYFGPSELLADDATSYPSQYAFNATKNTAKEGFIEEWNAGPKDKLYAEGGNGYKPVVKATEIKALVNELIAKEVAERGVDVDENSIVINSKFHLHSIVRKTQASGTFGY